MSDKSCSNNKLPSVTHKHAHTHTHRSLQSKARYSSISPSASITLGNSSPWLQLGVTLGWVTSTEGRHKTALRPCTHNLPHKHSGLKMRLYRTLIISHVHINKLNSLIAGYLFALAATGGDGRESWCGVPLESFICRTHQLRSEDPVTHKCPYQV